jgi:hypothetical protein
MQLLLQHEPVHDGACGATPAAAAAAGPPAGTATDAVGDGSEQLLSAEALPLLAYARGWFSMVLPLLGLHTLIQ